MNTTTYTNIIYYIKSILKSQDIVNFSNIAETVSHDSLTRTMYKEFHLQKHFWDFLSPNLDLSDAYLVIDDTIFEKPYSKANKDIGYFIRWVYSHKDNKCVKGVQIVVLLLVVGDIRIPIGFKIYDKTKTKIKLALELLSYARNVLGFRRMFVLFDSWYSCKKILKRIRDYGWYFVCRIKRNRKVSGKQVKNMFLNPFWEMRGVINGIKIILVRNRKHYLITNCLSLNKKDIIDWYSRRSIIEGFFRVIKSRFKIKSCQSRAKQAWKNHIFLVFFCFCLVELKRQSLGITIYKAKSKLRLGDYYGYLDKWKRILKNA